VIPSLLPACTNILLDKLASISACVQSPNLDTYARIYVMALTDVFEKCTGGDIVIEETSFKALLRILDIASLCPSESVFVADFLLESLKRLVVVLTTLISEGYVLFLSSVSDRASVLDAHVVPFFTSAIVTRTRPGIILLSSIFAACPVNQAGIVDGRLVDVLVLLTLEYAEDELVISSISKLIASLLNKCQDGL
jgi:hypothetical protein